MGERPTIDLQLTLDGQAAPSESTYTWAGAHVLVVHTVIPDADLALELHSTFVGHPGVATVAVHLVLGPPGREPQISTAEHDQLAPALEPRACAYEHAQQLIEILGRLGYQTAVHVADELAFAALEPTEPL